MIVVEDLSIQQGEFRLDGVSFSIPSGSYGVLMGQTGSGKTTILEAVCGLRLVSAGKIFLPPGEVTRLRPSERGLGYVPQDGVLFPTMTIREHLAFALDVRRWPRAEIRRRVDEVAAMLGIEALLPRRPHGLSGGERQRVALGRALAFRPQVLCLDEPLSALDRATREQMYALLGDIRQRTGVTVLHITHSHHEARRLGDTLLRLVDGKVVCEQLAD